MNKIEEVGGRVDEYTVDGWEIEFDTRLFRTLQPHGG